MSENQTTKRSSGANTDPSLRDRAGDAYDSARATAVDAYDAARDKAALAKERTSDGIDEAPLIALAGGLAVGVLLAALLPRTAKENELLGPIGERITGSAKHAVEAAKEAGRDKMSELNLTRDAGTSALEKIIRGVSDAALGAVKRPN
ncbi:MAG: DUF883 family protein [Sphingomonas sp.]|nr:DUF883 family protein [Sphingomonas sp.]